MMTTKEKLILAGKIVVLAFVLLTLQAIGSRFLPAVEGADPEAPASPGFLGLVLGVCLLQTVALAYPIVRSRWRRWPLVLTVFLLFFGTVTVMSQLESWAYLGDKMPPGMLSGLFLMGLFTAAIFSPLIVLTLGGWRRKAATDEETNARLRMSRKAWPGSCPSARPSIWLCTTYSATSWPGRTRRCGNTTAAPIPGRSSLRYAVSSETLRGWCPSSSYGGCSGSSWPCP
jgi:hypothetical protein